MEIEVLKDKKLTINIQNVKDIQGIKYLTKEQIDEALAKTKNNYHRILIKFLFTTGVRITEAINIKKEDILFEDNIIIIKWLKKRKYLTRTIPLHKNLKELLLLYTSQLNNKDKLFNISRIRAYVIVKKVLGVSPHKLRHSFSIHYLNSEGQVTELNKLLGHKYLNTTMVYSSITQKDLIKKINEKEF
jgi:integrase/recombinase XerD